MNDEDLLSRLRAQLGDDPNISEKKMFGGMAFMLNGNMLCGIMSTGAFLVRVGKEFEAEALKKPGTRLMEQGGRTMGGFITVDEAALEEDAAISQWLALATRFVGAMPPK